jgi:hypothetical protein
MPLGPKMKPADRDIDIRGHLRIFEERTKFVKNTIASAT